MLELVLAWINGGDILICLYHIQHLCILDCFVRKHILHIAAQDVCAHCSRNSFIDGSECLYTSDMAHNDQNHIFFSHGPFHDPTYVLSACTHITHTFIHVFVHLLCISRMRRVILLWLSHSCYTRKTILPVPGFVWCDRMPVFPNFYDCACIPFSI